MSDSNRQFTEERYGNVSMENTDYSIERVDQVLKWLPIDGDLLEIGVWDGSIVRHYRNKFQGRIFGLDLNLEIMKNAMPLLEEAKACDLNSDRIPWGENRFDVVVCNEVIEHIFDTDRLIEELHRVTKPNALLILSTPNLASLPNRICLLMGFQPYSTEVSCKKSNYGNPLRKSLNPAGHIRVFTARALKEILEANGFDVIYRKATPISTRGPLKLIEKIAAFVSVSFGSDLIYMCRKKS